MNVRGRGISLNLVAWISSIFLIEALGGIAATLLAQPSVDPGTGSNSTFRADTREVLVDAVVVDKKGNFQRDLKRQDFKILEDGKEQKITSFSLEGAGASGQPGKHFVALVFDADEAGFREAAIRFVDTFASPNLYVAVYARVNKDLQLALGFTSDRARIKAALNTMQVIGDPSKFLSSDDRPRRNLILERVRGVATALGPIRGRKALVLFDMDLQTGRAARDGAFITDEGIWITRKEPSPTIAQMSDAIADCNQAKVSVYSFHIGPARGGSGNFYDPPAPRNDPGASTNVMRDLAVGTGGRYIDSAVDGLSAYLAGIAAEQDDYYLLGYTPSAESGDKDCHKVKVTTDRRGLDVSARDSYCSSNAIGQFTATSPQKGLESRVASGVTGSITTALQLSWFYFKPNVAVVDIAMDIDPAVANLKGKLHGKFDLLGAAYRQDGSVAVRFGETVSLDFENQAQMDAFVKAPYHYSKQFNIAPGQYNFRMVAGSRGDKAFGSTEKPLNIEPWSGQTLSVSALALSEEDYPLTDVTAELDNSVLEGPYRFVSRGRETVPMGGTRFHTGGRGLFYFEVYEPRLLQVQPGKLPEVEISVLDRATGQQEADSGPMGTSDWIRPGNAVIPIALTLPVATLPAGSYTLEVRVTHDGGQDQAIRTADFDVK